MMQCRRRIQDLASHVFGAMLLLGLAGGFQSGQAQSAQPVELVRLATGQAAAFYVPQGKAKTTGLVYVHGTGGNFYSNAPPALLALAGYSVLPINTRYHDNGQFIGDPIELEALDIAAGIGYLKTRPGIRKIVLIGHSLGGPRVVFYQAQAQLAPGSAGRVPELKQAQLPPADAVIILAGVSDSAKSFMKALDPCMANFARNCQELDLLKHGPPFRDRDYLKKLRTTQQETYSDLINHAAKRLRELESDSGSGRKDELFLVDRGALGTSNPDFIDLELTGCGEDGKNEDGMVTMFFGFDAGGKTITKRMTCKEARTGHPSLHASVENYKAYINSPRSTAVHSLRAFLKYRGPETNLSIVRFIGQISTPVLMLNGAWDSLLLPWAWFENTEAVAKAKLKDFETYWIPGMSHGLTGPTSSWPEEQLTKPPGQKAEQKLNAIMVDSLRRKGFENTE